TCPLVLGLDCRVLSESLFESGYTQDDTKLWDQASQKTCPPHHSVDRLVLREFDRLFDDSLSAEYAAET
ncbi:MAG TPA: hypothetical protein PLR25_05540, partial [Planctomycetaceae bacterium]|nr:hypothetical protein [Planctomycetaceae bacterium]